MEIARKITQLENLEKCFKVGNVSSNPNAKLYKYMDFVSAIKSLKNNSLYIVEPSHWSDEFEKRFYCAKYQENNRMYVPHKVFACCFSKKSVCEAAWKVYASGKTGLASRCVQFVVDRKKLRECLNDYAKKHNVKIYEGDILYLYENELNGLHTSKSPHFANLFRPFTDENYYSLLLLKRPAFQYEGEVRFLFVDENDNNRVKEGDTRLIDLVWKNCVVEIKVDEHCCEEEVEFLKKILQDNGIEVVPKKFALNKKQKK